MHTSPHRRVLSLKATAYHDLSAPPAAVSWLPRRARTGGYSTAASCSGLLSTHRHPRRLTGKIGTEMDPLRSGKYTAAATGTPRGSRHCNRWDADARLGTSRSALCKPLPYARSTGAACIGRCTDARTGCMRLASSIVITCNTQREHNRDPHCVRRGMQLQGLDLCRPLHIAICVFVLTMQSLVPAAELVSELEGFRVGLGRKCAGIDKIDERTGSARTHALLVRSLEHSRLMVITGFHHRDAIHVFAESQEHKPPGDHEITAQNV